MKLDKFQKEARKNLMRDLLARGGIVATDGVNMTAIFVPAFTGNGNGHFSLSYAGNEKFKRKYGEYVALDRLSFGECLPMTEDDFYLFIDVFGLRIRENDPPISGPISQACDKVPAFVLIPSDAWPFPHGSAGLM